MQQTSIDSNVSQPILHENCGKYEIHEFLILLNLLLNGSLAEMLFLHLKFSIFLLFTLRYALPSTYDVGIIYLQQI
jgi:hypothetical protein